MHAKSHIPSLRFAAIFSQQSSAIDWAVQKSMEEWGAILFQSADIPFDFTTYYDQSMGKGLVKRLVAFRNLVDPTELVASKTRSNEWEAEFLCAGNDWSDRPLNIDPGYLTEAKVVLMTTKDRDHRLYLGDGIYGEVTLFFQLPGKWVDSRWTYPDYRRDDYHDFFHQCRRYLRECLQDDTKSK